MQYLADNQDNMKFHIAGIDNANDKVFGADYYRLLNRCKTGLCINKTNEYYLYASGRMSQYMSSGIMAFIPEGPQFEDIFGNDSFVSIANDEDLLDKIKYFTNNDNERTRIAQNGYTKIHDYFHVDKVCQYIIETTFDAPLSQEYNWPTDIY